MGKGWYWRGCGYAKLALRKRPELEKPCEHCDVSDTRVGRSSYIPCDDTSIVVRQSGEAQAQSNNDVDDAA
jgi:hypothetical protein